MSYKIIIPRVYVKYQDVKSISQLLQSVIQVLFEGRGCTIDDFIHKDQQCIESYNGYFISRCQAAVINMMDHGLGHDVQYKDLVLSFCVHPLYIEEKEERYRVLSIVLSWFEDECERVDSGESFWSKDELWINLQTLCLGVGIHFSDTTEAMNVKLKTFKRKVLLELMMHNRRKDFQYLKSDCCPELGENKLPERHIVSSRRVVKGG